jgi:obg-like ATPase 1
MENIQSVTLKKRGTDPNQKYEIELIQSVLDMLNNGEEIRFGAWKTKDIEYLNTWQLLTAKSVVYLVNMTPTDYIRQKNKWLKKISDYIAEKKHNSKVIPFSAEFEKNVAAMSPEDAEKYLTENKVKSQLPNIIKTGYKSLDLQYFFTAGEDEVKAWTIKKGSKAPQAGGKIHTDFEKGFINCEIMSFDDYKALGSEVDCRSAGKLRQEGKNYTVQDGDIIYFKTTKKEVTKKK